MNRGKGKRKPASSARERMPSPTQLLATTPLSKPPTAPSAPELLATFEVTEEQVHAVADLAERTFRHVLRAIDLDRLFQLEQCLWSELSKLDVPDDWGELATALLADALHNVGRSSERTVRTIPVGISDDEIVAAEYDENCLMCRHEADEMEYRHSGRRCQDLARDAEDRDMRQFDEQAATAWRAENADALRKFGLVRSGTDRAANSATNETTNEVTS